MPGIRRIWTGPHGSAPSERALEDATSDPLGLWIAPTPLARDQVVRALGLRLKVARDLRAWCWEDLWTAVRDASSRGPARLSDAAARAALGEAIAQARRDGALREVAEVVDWPGFRRRLRARIAAWTRAERPIEATAPGPEPVRRAQWAIFVRYRAILQRLDAEDAEGLAVWASKALVTTPPATFRKLGAVTFLDPSLESPAAWRVLEHAHRRARSVRVALAHDPDPALAEVFAEAAAIRERLLAWGFDETRVEPDLFRPAGLRDVERELFRVDSHRRERLKAADGLAVLGAPEGEGVGLVIAREVKKLLDRGTDPEEILVLFRHWDEAAALVLETLRAWGLPAAAEVPRPLSSEPALAALRLAMNLPVEEWEVEPLIRLLRNGQLRPDWPENAAPDALPIAASVLRSTRAFRGLEAIGMALDRAIGEHRKEPRKAERIRLARAVVDRLGRAIEPLDQPRPWRDQAERLRALADDLRLGGPGDYALDHLWMALEDHGAVLERLGGGDLPWPWPDFAREVDRMVGDLATAPPTSPGATVRLAPVDSVAGARATHVFLANLGEGTFPTREAVDPRMTPVPDESSPDTPNPAFAGEMLRFLRVIGSADEGLTLVYPTSDAQGQERLKAGFLDDVLGLFEPGVAGSIHEEHRRFDPALLEWPELAGAPADARVRAVARACACAERDELIALAGLPAHRPALEGTAAALRIAHARTRGTRFGIFDGRLSDPEAIRKILEKFGPNRPYSPSQLETYLFCPFQFFLRYALKLEPVDERDELDEDYSGHGTRMHDILEMLEQLQVQSEESRLDLAEVLIRSVVQDEPTGAEGVDAGLREIERGRLAKTIRRYVKQYLDYEALDRDRRPVPHRFEVVFGREDDEDAASHPALVLGEGPVAVRLQGKIDRIDLIPTAGRTTFRVIDYKTGTSPSKKDVKEAIYLQLPLYALAIERIVLRARGLACTTSATGAWRPTASRSSPPRTGRTTGRGSRPTSSR